MLQSMGSQRVRHNCATELKLGFEYQLHYMLSGRLKFILPLYESTQAPVTKYHTDRVS